MYHRTSVLSGINQVSECHTLIMHRTKSSLKNISQITVEFLRFNSQLWKSGYQLGPCRQISMNFDDYGHLNTVAYQVFILFFSGVVHKLEQQRLPLLNSFSFVFFVQITWRISLFTQNALERTWFTGTELVAPDLAQSLLK